MRWAPATASARCGCPHRRLIRPRECATELLREEIVGMGSRSENLDTTGGQVDHKHGAAREATLAETWTGRHDAPDSSVHRHRRPHNTDVFLAFRSRALEWRPGPARAPRKWTAMNPSPAASHLPTRRARNDSPRDARQPRPPRARGQPRRRIPASPRPMRPPGLVARRSPTRSRRSLTRSAQTVHLTR